MTEEIQTHCVRTSATSVRSWICDDEALRWSDSPGSATAFSLRRTSKPAVLSSRPSDWLRPLPEIGRAGRRSVSVTDRIRRAFGRAPKLRALAGIALALVGATCVTTIASPNEERAITIDSRVSLGALGTELDTQIIYPAVLDEDMPTAGEHLRAFAAERTSPLRVRLLLSTDGAYDTPDRRHKPTLPAGWKRGDWDFTSLDLLVNNVYAAGAEPVIDIGYMPDWMWNCGSGQPLDPTFVAFGDYAARLVAYSNRGGFSAEDGRWVANPAGTAHPVVTWELWNEPNFQSLSCLARGAGSAAVSPIDPHQYLAMWNSVAPRMRAIDP